MKNPTDRTPIRWRRLALFCSALTLVACSDDLGRPDDDGGRRIDALSEDLKADADGPKTDLAFDLRPDLATDLGPDLGFPDAQPPASQTGVVRYRIGSRHLRIMVLGQGIVRVT